MNLYPLKRLSWQSTVLTSLCSLAVLASTSGCAVFGVESVEEAPYELVREEKPFEIRDYAPLVVAQTRVDADFKAAGNEAFRKLFSYISGNNEGSEKIAMTAPVVAQSSDSDSGEKIAMTAPVISSREGEAWLYSFVLPKSFTLDTAPKPLDPEVTLTETQPQRVAIIRYSGRATRSAQSDNAAALAEWIDAQGLQPLSEPRWAGYNAPWALPPFRRNEVLIDISDQ